MSRENSSPQRKAKGRFRFKFVAMLLGIGLAFSFGEMALRILQPSQMATTGNDRDFFCRFDPQLGWAPIENITARHKKNAFSVMVHQNQFGLRGPDDMQFKRSDGKRRVLVLGDSYAWGYSVDQKELFCAPEVHGTNEEILNFGVSGYGNDQEYLLYLLRGTNFVVDEVVLALTPYNDIANNLAAKQYGHWKPYFTFTNHLVLHNEHVRDSKGRGFGAWLSRHSRVCNLVDQVAVAVDDYLDQRRKSTGTAKAGRKQLETEDVTANDREGVSLTVEILKSLRDGATAQHAAFSVIFIPYKPHIDQGRTNNHPLVPLIAEGLNRAGITYYEPYAEFLKLAQTGINPFNEPDNHFSPAGHGLFAKFLTRSLPAEGVTNYYGRQ